MKFTTAHLQFVKSTAHFLARTAINNFNQPLKMWEILLNSVVNSWLKWAVLLTNCKWAVVNSNRIQNWATHSYKSQMGYKFSATHFWPY